MPIKKNRPTLAEFDPDVLASDIQGQKLEKEKQASYEDYRNLLAAPVEDRATRIAKIAKGEAVAPPEDAELMKRAAASKCHDMKEACDLHHKNSHSVRYKALTALCKALLPEERAILRRQAAALVEAQAANLEYQELKTYLISEGGVVGMCLSHPEKILGLPADRSSDLAFLLREFVSLGVLDKMPPGLAS
jgi:hypothetical protein